MMIEEIIATTLMAARPGLPDILLTRRHPDDMQDPKSPHIQQYHKPVFVEASGDRRFIEARLAKARSVVAAGQSLSLAGIEGLGAKLEGASTCEGASRWTTPARTSSSVARTRCRLASLPSMGNMATPTHGGMSRSPAAHLRTRRSSMLSRGPSG